MNTVHVLFHYLGSHVNSPTVILTIHEVKRRTGLSRATIYRYQRDGQFPASVRRGLSRHVGWREEEVERFIRSCADSEASV